MADFDPDAELQGLLEAYASGLTSYRHGDREFKYDSGEQMLKRINFLRSEIAATASPASRARARAVVTTFSRGT